MKGVLMVARHSPRSASIAAAQPYSAEDRAHIAAIETGLLPGW